MRWATDEGVAPFSHRRKRRKIVFTRRLYALILFAAAMSTKSLLQQKYHQHRTWIPKNQRAPPQYRTWQDFHGYTSCVELEVKRHGIISTREFCGKAKRKKVAEQEAAIAALSWFKDQESAHDGGYSTASEVLLKADSDAGSVDASVDASKDAQSAAPDAATPIRKEHPKFDIMTGLEALDSIPKKELIKFYLMAYELACTYDDGTNEAQHLVESIASHVRHIRASC